MQLAEFISRIWGWITSSVMLVLIALLGAFIFIVSLIITLPITLVLMISGRGRRNVPDAVMEDYERVIEALEDGDLAFLDQWLAEDPTFVNGVDAFIGRRWVINAVDLGSTSSVRWFLDHGADVNFRDEEGRCLLDSAIQREGDFEIRRKSDPEFQRGSETIEILTLLLDAGADVNLPDVLQSTPLHFAAYHGSAEVVQFLMDRGANPLAYDADYVPATPIDGAQAAKRHEVAALMQAHADRMGPKDTL